MVRFENVTIQNITFHACNVHLPMLFPLQMVEIDLDTMMITLAQKGGEPQSREVSLTAHGPTFVSYASRSAGPIEDQTGVEVSGKFQSLVMCCVVPASEHVFSS